MKKIGMIFTLTGSILLSMSALGGHYVTGMRCITRGRAPRNAGCEITTNSVNPLVESCVANKPSYMPQQNATFATHPRGGCFPVTKMQYVVIILTVCEKIDNTPENVVDYQCIKHGAPSAAIWTNCSVHGG